MTRTIPLVSTNGEKVTGTLEGTGDIGIVLAHGAGAGQGHPWMTAVRHGLASAGHPTLTFDYAYTAAGRRSPDRMPRLLDVHAAAVEWMRGEVAEVVLAGKSMGGRVASHLVGDEGVAAAGLVYFGYPLVPMGKGEPRPTGHLERISVPQLFLAGTRDRLSPPPLVGELARSLPDAELVVVDEGDHSFKVTRRSGRSDDEALAWVVSQAVGWIDRRIPERARTGE